MRRWEPPTGRFVSRECCLLADSIRLSKGTNGCLPTTLFLASPWSIRVTTDTSRIPTTPVWNHTSISQSALRVVVRTWNHLLVLCKIRVISPTRLVVVLSQLLLMSMAGLSTFGTGTSLHSVQAETASVHTAKMVHRFPDGNVEDDFSVNMTRRFHH